MPRLGAVLVPLNPADPVRVEAALTVDGPLDGPEADVELRRSVDPDAVHSIIHTSGTSGRPRPVELSYANHHASAQASAGHLGVADDDRWLGVLPLFHVGGLAVLLRSVIYATTAVLHERFDPVRVRDAFAAGEVTLASLVPTMLTRLREAGLERAAPELRAILLGGGPIPDGLLDWAVAAGLPVSPTYGMTETASQVVTAPPGERSGRPLPGVELRTGDDGEIMVRGPMVARGALSADGWLHTGDRGHIDAEGRLHVDGRLKEIIVTGGENVSPVEVEEALLTHPAVADAGVAGRARRRVGRGDHGVRRVVLRGQRRGAARLDPRAPGGAQGAQARRASDGAAPQRHGQAAARPAAMTTVTTIGVYGFDLESFLAALRHADVTLLLDVRQRRGVRGSEYAWANSRRLQAALADAGVSYRHHLELAPTTELRRLQYAADDRQGVGKRSRIELAPEYRERYITEILDRADLGALVAELPARGAAALLCVERDPEACHRSLIAERLEERYGVRVEHLRPRGL